MSTQFGPLGESHDHSAGIIPWLADNMMVGTARLFTHLLDSSIRYDADRNRLSLHGESEHAGEGFAVGMIATMMMLSAAILTMVPVVIVGEISMLFEAPMPSLIAALSLASMAFGAINVFQDIMDRISSIEVYDHRTAATDDERLGELQAAYARGDLDRDAFEQEVEAVVEREAVDT